MAENDAAARSQTSVTRGPADGGSNQPAMEGRNTPGPESQSGSGGRSDARRRGKGRRMMGWQESKLIAPCATQANPNYVSDPAPPKGGAGRSYEIPL